MSSESNTQYLKTLPLVIFEDWVIPGRWLIQRWDMVVYVAFHMKKLLEMALILNTAGPCREELHGL